MSYFKPEGKCPGGISPGEVSGVECVHGNGPVPQLSSIHCVVDTCSCTFCLSSSSLRLPASCSSIGSRFPSSGIKSYSQCGAVYACRNNYSRSVCTTCGLWVQVVEFTEACYTFSRHETLCY